MYNKNFESCPSYGISCEYLNSYLNNMEKWKDDWDSYGSKKLNKSSIEDARKLIKQLIFNSIKLHYRNSWFDPIISADSEGDVYFAWFTGLSYLYIYTRSDKLDSCREYSLFDGNNCESGEFKVEDFPTLYSKIIKN